MNDSYVSSTNELLRKERLQRGWRQQDVAEYLETTIVTINRWERGIQSPSHYFRLKLCALFDKNEEELGLIPIYPEIMNGSPALIRQETFLKYSNRQRMLIKVHTFWIRGVFERIVQNVTPTSLLLQPAYDAVTSSWPHIANHGPSLLPTDMSITEVFDSMGGELLILGESGSGKTIVLLELARDLLDRAEHDESYPIPTIFHLSFWTKEELPLDQWLMKELTNKYQVPQNLSHEWIENDSVLPLLDGLDQVPISQRAKCITAINTYHQQHGLLPIVLCCRNTDYFLQTNRLLLLGAVIIRHSVFQESQSSE